LEAEDHVINWRKLLAGTLAAFCLLGGAATAADKPDDSSGRKHQTASPPKPDDDPKLDRKLNDRARRGDSGISRVIVTLVPGGDASAAYKNVGANRGRRLGIINSDVVSLPNGQLRKLASSPAVASMHWDRPTGGEMNRAAITVGARAVQQQLGYDGAGVGVAIIDSGITSWHDDLTYLGWNSAVRVVNGQRVVKFVDFVNGRTAAYDDNGHGSHVAGIIAGNGLDTLGARAGIAPAANLVSLKVLDQNGGGYISNVIAALDWVLANGASYRVRVVNLSVGAAITESYATDPLTLAAKRVVDAGVVVVTAAGNRGKNPRTGLEQFGGITAPGNAPWVLTVGAYSHNGTVTRTDDTMTDYSSRGPTAIDFGAKPDVVAPGTGIASLSVPGSLLYNLHPDYLLSGSFLTSTKPYLSLTGTSMASPMVAGTVALMMQANPKLTPNLAKAIIEYTAQNYGYGSLTQGAGFLNTQGAVTLARYLYTAHAGSTYPTNAAWSRTILWGNHKVKRGVIKPQGSAYALNTTWGAATDGEGDNIVWGTSCPTSDCSSVLWGASDMDGDNIVWGTFNREGDNIVWGTADCGANQDCDNIVWGTQCAGADGECDNIVWGTECGNADCDNIVWGTACDGNSECDNIVWGTACDGNSECDNIVWGTACDAAGECDNIVWGTAETESDNIVWGTQCDPNTECDNIVWGTSGEESPLFDDPSSPSDFDNIPFESLFGAMTMTTTSTTIVSGGGL
jgi:serine protease AprX